MSSLPTPPTAADVGSRPAQSDSNAPAFGRLEVLVVAHDATTRLQLEEMVRRLGHECRGARDGREGWELHQAQRADVVLSDWKMPGMDGVELCRQIRAADQDTAYTYFVFLTAHDEKEHVLLGMEAGADDFHSLPIDQDELQARLLSAGRLLGSYRRLAAKNRELQRDSQTSFQVARVDPLTGVSNRLRMNEDLEVLWSQVVRYRRRYAIAICDIDEFKKYNDHFGHLAGDEVLRRIAQTIRKALRQGDSLYRYGGEEFVVVLPEQPLGEAARAMDRVRREVEQLGIPTVARRKGLTISVGVAEFDLSRDTSLDGWLGRADAALYRAKENGRNRLEVDPVPRPEEASRPESVPRP
jgi:diguanylate cyclase (GGDEF)-like protein